MASYNHGGKGSLAMFNLARSEPFVRLNVAAGAAEPQAGARIGFQATCPEQSTAGHFRKLGEMFRIAEKAMDETADDVYDVRNETYQSTQALESFAVELRAQ